MMLEMWGQNLDYETKKYCLQKCLVKCWLDIISSSFLILSIQIVTYEILVALLNGRWFHAYKCANERNFWKIVKRV